MILRILKLRINNKENEKFKKNCIIPEKKKKIYKKLLYYMSEE